MKYYVYALIDPRTNTPFYIGKGSKNRMFDHLKDNRGVRKQEVISQIRKDGLEPVPTKLVENLTEDDAYKKEIELIKKYGRKGIDENGILCNNLLEAFPPIMTDDLKAHLSKVKKNVSFSQEHRKKLSKAKKDRTWEEIFGEHRAKELREQRSQPRGPMSKETKKNISQAKKGKKPHNWDDNARKKLSETLRGVPKGPNKKLSDFLKKDIVCPYCSKQGRGVVMRRWHFSNCKEKND